MLNPTEFPSGETTFLIDGAVGQLELLTLSVSHPQGVAVICHPHPLHQGTMHNKVVHTLSRAFQQLGLHSIRFNYRGVGNSEGQYGNSEGEVADLLAVLKWADKVLNAPKVILAGFSFGAFIAAMGATQHACEQLYSIAPAVTNQPYEKLTGVNCPWIVIQGELDEVIAVNEVYDWFEKQQASMPQMALLKMANASHFFHGHLIALRALVQESFIKS